VDNHLEYEVEAIFKNRKFKKEVKEYLIKWQGYYEKQSIWMLGKDMENAKEVIVNFEENMSSNKRQRRH
jgi:prenyltransferase beta subunit